jgi:hypothetical protein
MPTCINCLENIASAVSSEYYRTTRPMFLSVPWNLRLPQNTVSSAVRNSGINTELF